MDVCIRESNGGDMMITAGGWKQCQEKCMTQKHRPILSTKSLLSAHCRQATCYIIIHVISWTVHEYRKSLQHVDIQVYLIPHTNSMLIAFKCVPMMRFCHVIFIVDVCSCMYSYKEVIQIKWDSEESLSSVMQMMIIKKWCIAIIIVLAVFVCKFNIQILLCLKINI